MDHTRHARTWTLFHCAFLSPIVLCACAQYPATSDYDIHLPAVATINKIDYPAKLHLRLNGRVFFGYYIVDLPDYTLRRRFTATPFYYAMEHAYQGAGGHSETVNFQDEVNGNIAWFECSRTFNSVLVYDQFKWDTIPHFIGIRIEAQDTLRPPSTMR